MHKIFEESFRKYDSYSRARCLVESRTWSFILNSVVICFQFPCGILTFYFQMFTWHRFGNVVYDWEIPPHKILLSLIYQTGIFVGVGRSSKSTMRMLWEYGLMSCRLPQSESSKSPSLSCQNRRMSLLSLLTSCSVSAIANVSFFQQTCFSS